MELIKHVNDTSTDIFALKYTTHKIHLSVQVVFWSNPARPCPLWGVVGINNVGVSDCELHIFCYLGSY